MTATGSAGVVALPQSPPVSWTNAADHVDLVAPLGSRQASTGGAPPWWVWATTAGRWSVRVTRQPDLSAWFMLHGPGGLEARLPVTAVGFRALQQLLVTLGAVP